MRIGNGVRAIAVGIFVLLSQASDSRLESSRPTSSAVVHETARPEPPPTKEVEPPRTIPAPTAPPSSPVKPRAPLGEAPAATRRPPAEAPKPPAVAAESTASQQSAPPPVEPVPQQSSPAQKSQASPESSPPAEPALPKEATLPQPAKPAATTLDLAALEQRLRDTRAIGVFTKLSLKNQVDDLLNEFREFHRARDRSMLAKLRQAFDLLLLKVLSLLQDGDPELARDVSSSREALWDILIDPDKFKNL